MIHSVIDWISKRKTGSILYASPSRAVRDAALKAMAQIAVCSKRTGLDCDCADCFNAKAATHPHVSIVTEETFDEKMKVLYSYPTPVVQISELHRISYNRQTRLLIWLESIDKDRLIMSTCDSEFSILPTIRSRSVVFTEIPLYRLSEEENFKVRTFLQNLWSGRERFESITTPDDARQMAYHIRQVVINELEDRMRRPAKKNLSGSDVELQTLIKVIARFTSDPPTHNLRLLLNGFSMMVLQSIR